MMLNKVRTPVFLLLVAGAGSLLAQTTAQPQNETERERTSYLQLNRQIYHRHEDPDSGKIQAPDQLKPIEARLRAAIQGVIARALRSAPEPTREAVEAAISGIQGELTFGRFDLLNAPYAGPNMSNAPFADFSRLNAGEALTVAYVVLEGGDGIPNSLPFIEFYTRENGAWNLKATVDSDFISSTFFISRIKAGLAGESWYLAWGQPIGGSGGYLNLRLYGFDGSTVRTVWKRDDLAGGEIKVSSDSITLDYEEGHHSPTERANQIHEVFHVTVNGLQ